jgi:hypothetical protein
VGEGSCIGHKRIQEIAETVTDALRLLVTKSVATPRIAGLEAYKAPYNPLGKFA